jgi:hypothetical protein
MATNFTVLVLVLEPWNQTQNTLEFGASDTERLASLTFDAVYCLPESGGVKSL